MYARSPYHVLLKPIGPVCNIDCEYCFYLEKSALFPGHRTVDFMMSEETLEEVTRAYIHSQPEGTAEINFAWQGGEPTLMGVNFFRKAVELQKKYARPGIKITNAIQTNGTRLDAEWGEFLRENEFLVGISIDGPEAMHNRYRRDRGGAGTFASVMRGIEVLKRHRVEFNTLTVVQEHNGDYPAPVYTFLKKIGSTFMQFIPIVEKTSQTSVGERSVGPEQWGRFMSGVFDLWLKKDLGRIFVQHFDMLLGLWMGYPSSMCVHAETCGRAVALEHDGSLFSCDHFVNPEHRLGVFRVDGAGAARAAARGGMAVGNGGSAPPAAPGGTVGGHGGAVASGAARAAAKAADLADSVVEDGASAAAAVASEAAPAANKADVASVGGRIAAASASAGADRAGPAGSNPSGAAALLDGAFQTAFGNAKRDSLPEKCRVCTYRHLCHGACPKDRGTFHGVEGLNYLCPGYFGFYRHTEPFFKAMAEALRRQLPASEFRQFLKLPDYLVPKKNAPCPCGSGKKYKLCHGSDGA